MQDNLRAHKLVAMYEEFEPQRAKANLDKIQFVFTPKHGSWLNMAEKEFSVLKRQVIKNRIADKETLKRKINCWQQERNQKQVKANWQFTTKEARVKHNRLYPQFNHYEALGLIAVAKIEKSSELFHKKYMHPLQISTLKLDRTLHKLLEKYTIQKEEVSLDSFSGTSAFQLLEETVTPKRQDFRKK